MSDNTGCVLVALIVAALIAYGWWVNGRITREGAAMRVCFANGGVWVEYARHPWLEYEPGCYAPLSPRFPHDPA